MNELNLYQRINECRKTIEYIQKDKSISTGVGSYKAVTHDAVTAQVRPAMIKFGIICYPVLIKSVMNPPMVNMDGTQAKQMRYEATYDFHVINADKPEETFVSRIEAHAMDNADKAPGKAMSYAKKIFVLKLFDIESGDDEESRYTEPENKSLSQIELAGYVANIKNANGEEEKKRAYKSAIAACAERNDVEAANRIKAEVATK